VSNFTPYIAPTGAVIAATEPSMLELKRLAITERVAAAQSASITDDTAKSGRHKSSFIQNFQATHERWRDASREKRLLETERDLAVQRMKDAGWPGVVLEYVEGWRAMGFKRTIVTLPVIQLCGDPLERYIEDEDGTTIYPDKPAWLGQDGHLYTLNSFFWLIPEKEFAPLAKANTAGGFNGLYASDSLLDALRALQ